MVMHTDKQQRPTKTQQQSRTPPQTGSRCASPGFGRPAHILHVGGQRIKANDGHADAANHDCDDDDDDAVAGDYCDDDA